MPHQRIINKLFSLKYGAIMVQEINRGGEQILPKIRFKSEECPPQDFFSLILELQPSQILMEFNAHRIVVGRSSGADFRLPSLCVSRRHCMLNWSEQGWVLRDLDSRNGTYVNGNPIKAMIGSARNLFAGILFIIPGVITDSLAVILLLIPIKNNSSQNDHPSEDDVIEGEYRRDDELLK